MQSSFFVVIVPSTSSRSMIGTHCLLQRWLLNKAGNLRSFSAKLLQLVTQAHTGVSQYLVGLLRRFSHLWWVKFEQNDSVFVCHFSLPYYWLTWKISDRIFLCNLLLKSWWLKIYIAKHGPLDISIEVY